MKEIIIFQQLKNDVLLKYKEYHPFFNGSWKTFSSSDIQNLIDLISENLKQSISEKWIYTHLKPEQNEKLPRKDMLDILSQFVGFSNWDEYVFKNEQVNVQSKNQLNRSLNKKKNITFLFGLMLTLALSCYLFFKKEFKTITIEEKHTNEAIKNDVEVLIMNDSTEIPIEVTNSKIEIPIKDSTKLKLKSPFYKEKTVIVNKKEDIKIQLEPNDYALILKGFMKADIKDWQTRKNQMGIILDDNLEVLVMLKDNLGAEYFNKEEFIELVTVPTTSLKKMKIIELKSSEQTDKINFIRILQE